MNRMMHRCRIAVSVVMFVVALAACGGGGDGGEDGGVKLEECGDYQIRVDTTCYYTCRTASDCPGAVQKCQSIGGNKRVCVDESNNPGTDTGMTGGPDTGTPPPSDTGTQDTGMDQDTNPGKRDTGQDPDGGQSGPYENIQGSGVKSCVKVSECWNGCDNVECKKECLRSGTSDASKRYKRLHYCTEASCPDDKFNCILEQCGQHKKRCGLTGTKDCTTGAVCLRGCAAGGSSSCVDECYRKRTLDAQKKLNTYVGCTLDRCKNSNDLSCSRRRCDRQLRSCGAVGSKTCRQVSMNIVLECPNQRATCFYEQLYQGTVMGQENYLALYDCTTSKCANINNFVEARKCWLNQCETDMRSCGLVGQTGCSAIANCLERCPPSPLKAKRRCQLSCFYDGDRQGQTLYYKYGTCVENNCGASPSKSCIRTHCGSELQACSRD